MNKIVSVEPLDDYKILLTFSNNEKRIKDMKPYLDKGVFQKLKDKNLFNNVQLSYGTVTWDGEIDLCADSIYETSTIYNENK